MSNFNWKILMIFVFIFTIKTLFITTGFFWDSVTILSKTATFLYHTNFSQHIPSNLDNGDPFILPGYIALVWKLAGRTPIVTHLAFLPAIIIALIYLLKTIELFFERNISTYVFLLLVCEPAFTTQITGLYQDAFTIALTITAFYYIITKRYIAASFFTLTLCLISRRAILMAFSLIIFQLVQEYITNKNITKVLKKHFKYILPSTLIVLSFIIWRLSVYGWFFTTTGTEYGDHTNLSGIIKNTLTFIRWQLENGRIAIWSALIIFVYMMRKRNIKLLVTEMKDVLLAYLIITIVLISVTIPLQNPFGARYFIFLYLLLCIITAKIISTYLPLHKSKKALIALAIILFTGNFWKYPDIVAQPWDCKLSHLGYFNLKTDVIDYLNKNNIPLSDVGCGFPMYSATADIDINNDQEIIHNINLKSNKYVIYSNIFNLPDEEIIEIETWPLIKRFNDNFVFFEIRMNPKFQYKL